MNLKVDVTGINIELNHEIELLQDSRQRYDYLKFEEEGYAG